MKYLLMILSFSALGATIEGCISKGTPIIAVGTPRFVPQSQPDSVQEAGIRQDPNTGGMFLQWYSVIGATSYQLFRSDTTNAHGSPIAFFLVGSTSHSSVVSDTSFTDVSVTTGVEYYYYVVAYASDLTASAHSDTVNYKLLNRPTIGHPGPNSSVVEAGLYFSWQDYTGGGYTVIRVEDISQVPARILWVTKRFQIFQAAPSVSFNFDSTATSRLISGHSYQWRVERFDIDGTGRPYEGCTSRWGAFTVK